MDEQEDMLAEAAMIIEDAAPHDLARHVAALEALLQRLHVRRLATPPLPGPSPPPIMMCDHLGCHLMVGERAVVERGDAGPTIFEIVRFSRADAVLGRAFELARHGAKYGQRRTEPLSSLRGTYEYEVIRADGVYCFAPDKAIVLITIVHADDTTGRQPAPVVKRLTPLYVVEGMRNVYVISHEEVGGMLRELTPLSERGMCVKTRHLCVRASLRTHTYRGGITFLATKVTSFRGRSDRAGGARMERPSASLGSPLLERAVCVFAPLVCAACLDSCARTRAYRGGGSSRGHPPWLR